jgi:two-component system cell cycle sensor histidine kinase/response regulator CckA
MNSKAGRDSVPRYLILAFLLFAIGICGAGYLYYEGQKTNIENDWRAEISAIADLKVKRILDWRTERAADAAVIFENPIVVRRVKGFLESPGPSPQLRKELVDWMASRQTHYQYESIFLLDRRGGVRLTANAAEGEIGRVVQALALDAMRAKKIVFSDLRHNEVTDRIDLDIFVPLLVHQRESTLCVGAYVLRIDPNHFLYPLIQLWPVGSRTSETLLLRREGDEVLFLNELRGAKNAALSLKLPLSQRQLPSGMAVQGKEGIVEGSDHRGVPVLAALRAIPDSPWFLVAKVDLEEVYGPIHERAYLVILLVLVLIVLTGGIVVVLVREQRLRYYRSQYEVELERNAIVRHYEYLTKYANDIILLADERGNIVEANDRAVAAYGFSREELIGRNVASLHSDGAGSSLEARMNQVERQNGLVFESIHRRRDGSTFPVETSSRLIEVEGRKFIQNIMRDITERKETEEEIRILAQAVRSTSECVLIGDLEDNLLFVNDAFARTYGYEKEELIGRNVWIIRSERNPAELVTQILPATLRGGWQGELLNRRKDGTEFPIFLSTSVVYDESGAPFALVGIAKDITEPKRAEEALRYERNLLRTLIDNLPDGIYVKDIECRKTIANPADVRNMGRQSEAEVLGKNDFDFYPEEIAAKFYADDQTVLQTSQPVLNREEYVLDAAGQRRWLSTSKLPLKDGQGRIIGLVGIGRDITERKQMEDALRESEERYRKLVETAPDVIYSLSEDGAIKTLNPAFERITGWSPDESLGKPFMPFVHPDDMPLAERSFREVMRGETPAPHELGILSKSGEYLIAEFVATPQIIDGRVIGELGIARNITERKRAEVALRESEHKVSEALEFNRRILDTSCIGILTYKKSGQCVSANAAAAKVVGAAVAQLLAQNFHEIPSWKKSGMYQAAIRALDTGIEQSLEVHFVTTFGKDMWLSSSFSSFDSAGERHLLVFVTDITERKRVEEALRHEKALMDALMDNIPDSIYFKDRQCRLVRINRKMMQSLKLDEMGKAIGKTDVDLYGEDFGQKTFAEDQHLMTSGEPIVGLLESRQLEDGQINWTSTTKVPLRDDRGEIVGLVGITREINELMRVQEVLSQERNLLRSLIDSLPDQIYVKDLESRFLVCNAGVARMAGVARPEDLLEKTDFDIFPEELAAQYYADEQRAMKFGEPIIDKEEAVVNKAGIMMWSSTTKVPVRDSQGNIIGLVGLNRDMTERKRTEERLRLSDEILQRVNALVLVGDGRGEITYVSPSVKKILGYDPAEILGDGWWHVTREDGEERSHEKEFVARTARGEIPMSTAPYEKIVKSRDGVPHHILWQDTKGPGNSVIGIGHDISERKLLEEQLRQAQKLESLGTLAGGIAHDFNNVLGIILGYATILEEAKDDPKKSSRSIVAINKAVQRGAGLVRQLLTFARKTDTLFESVRLNDVILELAGMLEQTFPRTIQVSSQLEKEIPSITGDGNQLHQALLNLSVNARDAMPSGGTLTFSTRAVMGVEVRRRFPEAQKEKYVCISVADTGIGMDKPLLARAFEPFFTTKEEGHGTGLGLAVVYGIVTSHHGFIDVESQVGRGTTFRLYFPIPERSIQMPLVATEQPQGQTLDGTETLLVVEDEEMMLDLLKNILEGKGYRVMTAKDGAEAIEMYAQHRDQIDLVLMDMGLPKVGGAEALQRLQSIDPKVKVILASGYISPHVKSEVLKAGVKHFVQKPYVPQEVLRRIRKVFESDKQL